MRLRERKKDTNFTKVGDDIVFQTLCKKNKIIRIRVTKNSYFIENDNEIEQIECVAKRNVTAEEQALKEATNKWNQYHKTYEILEKTNDTEPQKVELQKDDDKKVNDIKSKKDIKDADKKVKIDKKSDDEIDDSFLNDKDVGKKVNDIKFKKDKDVDKKVKINKKSNDKIDDSFLDDIFVPTKKRKSKDETVVEKKQKLEKKKKINPDIIKKLVTTDTKNTYIIPKLIDELPEYPFTIHLIFPYTCFYNGITFEILKTGERKNRDGTELLSKKIKNELDRILTLLPKDSILECYLNFERVVLGDDEETETDDDCERVSLNDVTPMLFLVDFQSLSGMYWHQRRQLLRDICANYFITSSTLNFSLIPCHVINYPRDLKIFKDIPICIRLYDNENDPKVNRKKNLGIFKYIN